jgi:hypothetical protein
VTEDWNGEVASVCAHRTAGGRAWCLDCIEWCYPDEPCRGCVEQTADEGDA